MISSKPVFIFESLNANQAPAIIVALKAGR
jgi:hypothetical protein